MTLVAICPCPEVLIDHRAQTTLARTLTRFPREQFSPFPLRRGAARESGGSFHWHQYQGSLAARRASLSAFIADKNSSTAPTD